MADADLVAYVYQVIVTQSSGNEEPDTEEIAKALKAARLKMPKGNGMSGSSKSTMDTTALTQLLNLTAQHLRARAR